MATLAGSVSIDAFGVATGSGMALALYSVLIASPTYSGIAGLSGVTTALLVQSRKQLAEMCNAFATISDGPQWIVTPLKTANYNAGVWEMVRCDPAIAPFFVSLPNAATIPAGVCVGVKNASLSNNNLVVNSFGGVIDGSASFTFGQALACYQFMSDGANWFVSASF